MPDVRTYDPARVLVVVGGIPIGGFAEDTFINIEPLADAVSSVAGADGEVSRAMGTDRRHAVTITLNQTSPSNDALSTLHALDRRTGGGGLVPLAVTDLSGRTLFAVSKAWVSRMPASSFGSTLVDREWVLHTGEPAIYVAGGNS